MTTIVNHKVEFTSTSVTIPSLVSSSDSTGQAPIAGPSVERTTESRCNNAQSISLIYVITTLNYVVPVVLSIVGNRL